MQSKATLVEKKALPCAFTEALTETFDAMAGHLKKKDLARLTEFMLHTHIRTIFDVVYSIQRFRNICPSHEYAAHKIFVPENFPQRMFQVDVTVGFETCQHSRLKNNVVKFALIGESLIALVPSRILLSSEAFRVVQVGTCAPQSLAHLIIIVQENVKIAR